MTPEDILLAKLHRFRAGGEVSEVQWPDIQGLVRAAGATLDRRYLEQGAGKLGIPGLLERAMQQLFFRYLPTYLLVVGYRDFGPKYL